jgi:hypothetical protein
MIERNRMGDERKAVENRDSGRLLDPKRDRGCSLIRHDDR